MVHQGGISAAALVVVLFIASAQGQRLHELLTHDEFFHVFGTTRDNVPQYELAPIMHNLTKRSTSGLTIKFEAFGEKVESYLKPADGTLAGENTPIWRSFTNAAGEVRYSKMRDGIVGLVARSYESAEDITSIAVRENDEKNYNFYGSIDDNSLRVVPIPARVEEVTDEQLNKLRTKRETLDENPDMKMSGYHVIIKTESYPKTSIAAKRMAREMSRVNNTMNHPRWKRSQEDVIYPSLLISTDYKDPKTTMDDLAYYDDIIYQLAFWNAVDLRFRHLESPKVRIRIAGIIFGQSRSASPWIYNHMKGDEIDGHKAWEEMQTFWWNKRSNPDFPHDAYNIAVSMTDLKMYTIGKTGDAINTLGLASIGGLCKDSSYWNIMQSNMITIDHRGFDGVRTATHELGHVLGAYHDELPSGGCRSDLGFIMAPTSTVTKNSLQWSSCSKRYISMFLRNKETNCADRPSTFHPSGPPVKEILPGFVLDDHQQCQALGYYWACDTSPSNCQKLRCSYSGFHKFFSGCYDVEPAAEGTPCSEHAACIDGKCIPYYDGPTIGLVN